MVLNPNSVETHTLSDWSLGQTLGLLSAGSFSRPSFQRDFVWDEDLISELIRSVFLGYHIGNLLLWQPDDGLLKKMSPEPLYGINEQRPHQHGDRTNRTDSEIIVLDGQQRLTALHYAFSAPNLEIPDSRHRGIPVRFFLRINEFMRYLHGASNSADQLTAPDLVHCEPAQGDSSGDPSLEKHLLPLSLLEAEAAPRLRAWLTNYASFWSGRHEELKRVADELKRVAGDLASQVDEQRTPDAEDAWAAKETELEGVARELETVAQHDKDAQGLDAALRSVREQYKVQFILLRRDESPDRVKDTFMQVNRRGKQLNNFELFSAEASWMGMKPTHLVEEASDRLRANDRLDISRERLQYFIPQLMLLRRRPGFTSDEIYSMRKFETYFGRFFLPGTGDDPVFTSAADFENAWWAAFEDLRSGLLALRDHEMFGAVEKDNYHCFALYDGLVPAFAAIWSDAHRAEITTPEPLRDKKIHQWYWSRVFSDDPYLNAPSDLEWSERESNAVMMINDHREVMAWLERSGDRRQDRPKVVDQTASRMSASQARRTAHRHDGRMPSGGNSQDRAATAVYYSVLNFMNTIGPKHLVWNTPYQPVRASAILTQAWADRAGNVSPTEIASPFNQLLTDDYTHELIQLGMTHASYFRELEFAWNHSGRNSRRYVEMLKSHCLSGDMYDALTEEGRARAKGGKRVGGIGTSMRISDRSNEQDLEWKLERWRRGQRRIGQEQKEINSSAFSAQDYRQFIVDREKQFLREFGERVSDVDLNIGMEDRGLALVRAPRIEEDLRHAIGRLLVKLSSRRFEERVKGAQSTGGRLSRAVQQKAPRAKRLAESACECKTEEQAEDELTQGGWDLAHSQWFTSVFYNELAQQEGWPEGKGKGTGEFDTFMADLESLRKYRNPFLHATGRKRVRAETRNLGRDAIDALEQHWGLGG